jgi:hypothetical protein
MIRAAKPRGIASPGDAPAHKKSPILSDPKWPVFCRFLGGFWVAEPESPNSAYKRRLWPVITPKKRQKTPIVTISNKNNCDSSLF